MANSRRKDSLADIVTTQFDGGAPQFRLSHASRSGALAMVYDSTTGLAVQDPSNLSSEWVRMMPPSCLAGERLGT